MSNVGRPRIELTDEHVEIVERLASYGLTQAQIAEWLPMADRTLRERLRDPDEAVSAAYARGRAKDLEALSARHRDIAMGAVAESTVADQRKALEWRMERQHKFAERVEHSGPDGSPVQIAVTRKVVRAPANRITEHVNSANGDGRD